MINTNLRKCKLIKKALLSVTLINLSLPGEISFKVNTLFLLLINAIYVFLFISGNLSICFFSSENHVYNKS